MRVATTCNLAERNRVSDRQIAFYGTVARGGVGTIVTESLRVHPSTRRTGGSLSVNDSGVIPGLQRLADAVHEAGALLIGQLNHGGRQHHNNHVSTMWAPSAIPCPKSGGTPHAMSLDEVEEVIAHFVTSAANVVEGGLDGVEIHGAQGHLIGQFLSPFSNQREDEYGGSFENRLNFVQSILRRVRQRVGDGPIVGYRMGVEEFTPGGIDIKQAVRIGRALVDAGLIDYLSLSQGNFNSLDTHLPDRHSPPMVYIGLQEQVKHAISEVPVVACTHIRTPEHGESIIARGQADMVGLARALLADPEWPNKAAGGHAEDIRYCIACNSCWGSSSSAGSSAACAINPRAGRELALDAAPAAKRARRVVVVGGGPAGLEAARTAAMRGHSVVLFERSPELGGKLRLVVDQAPNSAELGNIVNFLVRQNNALGVQIRTGVTATVEMIAAEAPDFVIVATGATAYAPAIGGDGSVPVLASDGPLPALPDTRGSVVIMDEDGQFWAAAAAETVAAMGRKPIVVTRFFEPFRELPAVSRMATLRALDLQGAEMRSTMAVDRSENGRVILRHFLSGREESLPECSAIVWVGRQNTNDAIAIGLRGRGIAVAVIGDAFQPRRLATAIHEGFDLASSL